MTSVSTIRPDGIKVVGLSHEFKGERVLNNIDCSFPFGSLVAVLGPSGCGKTTFLRCLSGLLQPDSGRVRLNGMSPTEARKSGEVGNAFQFPTLLPWRTVLSNVLLPVELLGKGQNGGEKEFALELLSTVELSKDISKYPYELSGGMQQRVGLARALVTHPSFLFLDEPFGLLDGTTREYLNEKLRELWGRLAFTVVFVTHSIPEAVYVAEKVLVFSNKPARIKGIVSVPLGTDRPHNVWTSEEFSTCESEIRDLIRSI